jgi:hypothetical protein
MCALLLTAEKRRRAKKGQEEREINAKRNVLGEIQD